VQVVVSLAKERDAAVVAQADLEQAQHSVLAYHSQLQLVLAVQEITTQAQTASIQSFLQLHPQVVVQDLVQQARSITASQVDLAVVEHLLAQAPQETLHRQAHHKEALVAMVVQVEIQAAVQVVAHPRLVAMAPVQQAAQVVLARQILILVHL
jgi:hypothetical protein